MNALVLNTARDFHSRAGLDLLEVKQPVIEVAHQPLFLPSTGFFHKIALGCWLAEKRGGTCVFGFVDDDFALFPCLWSARVPAENKAGYEKIGFKVKDCRKAFFVVPKPGWNELKNAARWAGLQALNWDCDSLSGFNALLVARVCNLMGLKPLFFEYSKLPPKAVEKQVAFFEENQKEFVSAFNASVKKRGVKLKPMREDELPLWRVNEDGSKRKLRVGEKARRYAFTAVARNIAFASLLGSEAYVSGAGAFSGKGYGAVARDVCEALGCVEPEAFVWLNEDVYGSVSRLDYSVAALLAGVSSPRDVKRNWFASLDSAKPVKKEFYTEYESETRHGL